MNKIGRQRQWQWVEDYCIWLEDGSGPQEAAEAMDTMKRQLEELQKQAKDMGEEKE